MTEKEHCARLPLASVAITITFVVPTGKLAPEAWLYAIVGLPSDESALRGAVPASVALLRQSWCPWTVRLDQQPT